MEFRGVFRFLRLKKQTPTKTYRDGSETYGSNRLISRRTIGKRCEQFENGRTGATDQYRYERPSTAPTNNNVERVNESI